ncbi:MAG TPA: thiolase family protein, partial [Alphaproteobacteria bacterium]
MRDAYIIGAFTTPFGRFHNRSYKELTREAYLGAIADAGLSKGEGIEFAYFSNCGMWVDNQACIHGQVCFTPLVKEGLFPERVPMINVEGGCASGQMALHSAWKDILSGQSEMTLAIGVEKLYNPDHPEKTMNAYKAGIDNFDVADWEDYYTKAAAKGGVTFEPGPNRTIFMDTYALQAAYHMKKYGTTQRQFAIAAAKNHANGAKNPKSQYKFNLSPDQVLADRAVTFPFTRAMCAPVGDGAAALVL